MEKQLNINRLIESVGLTAEELKPYVLGELEEFMEAESYEDQFIEFHDILFALKNLAYVKTGKHVEIDESVYVNKIRGRIKEYSTLSKKSPIYNHNSIRKMPIGIVHLCIGNFKQPWSQFDPFKNGTEAEVAMLTDNEFCEKGRFTNSMIVTFDDVDTLEYSFLASSWNESERNVILCRVPDFVYTKAKEELSFEEAEVLLSLQMLSALENASLRNDCIFHFHSWESGTLIGSEEFRQITNGKKRLFSPYLTVTRLQDFCIEDNAKNATLSNQELEIASKYELDIMQFCEKMIVESEADKKYYEDKYDVSVEKYAYTSKKDHVVNHHGPINDELCFIAGGRPVYEKGFLELIKQVPGLVDMAKSHGLVFHLKIFCKEYDRRTKEIKKSEYIHQLESLIEQLGLQDVVSLYDKVSIAVLREEIQASSGLIVPSLYDPYCLMPHYAIDVNRISFVSSHTGISENIKSSQYVFNPKKPDSLVKAMKKWLDEPEDFVMHNGGIPYTQMYLEAENGNRK